MNCIIYHAFQDGFAIHLLERHQKYYAKKKKDPAFMEERRQRAAAFRATAEGKAYQKAY